MHYSEEDKRNNCELGRTLAERIQKSQLTLDVIEVQNSRPESARVEVNRSAAIRVRSEMRPISVSVQHTQLGPMHGNTFPVPLGPPG